MKTRIKFFDSLKQLCVLELDMSGRITDCHPMRTQEWDGVRIDLDTIRLFERPQATHYGRKIDIEWYVIYVAVDPGISPWKALPQHLKYVSTEQLLADVAPFYGASRLISNQIMVIADSYKEFVKSLAIHNSQFELVEVTIGVETKCYLLPKPTTPWQ